MVFTTSLFFSASFADIEQELCHESSRNLILNFQEGGSNIEAICYSEFSTIKLKLKTNSEGDLKVQIPIHILNSFSSCEKMGPVLTFIDGKEKKIVETEINPLIRQITIPISPEYQEIKISALNPGNLDYDEKLECLSTPIKNMTPKQQLEKGIYHENVICQNNFKLVQKIDENVSVCVKPETLEKIIQRGWGKEVISLYVIETLKEEKIISKKIQDDKETEIIESIPSSSKTILNFYLKDDDLNTSPNGIDTISTQNLIEATINGVLIEVSEKMIETSPGSGEFFLKINLPDTVSGRPINQDDVIVIKYFDQSGKSGEVNQIEKSISLSQTFAQIQTMGGGQRIGHEFGLRIYEPDFNIDSKREDSIPLHLFEFRAKGGIRTNLSNPSFDANSSVLKETGPNSDIFEVKIKIPRELDGKIIHIGDWYEIRYIDKSTPSETNEKIILTGRIG